MKRTIYLLYGVICYFIFFGTFLYAIGFIGNIFVPKSIDSSAGGPLAEGLLINFALLAVFALQHSIMARKGFKKIWTKIIPTPLERSTYTLFSSLALILLFWQWRPLGGIIWNIQDPSFAFILQILCGFGFLIVLITTFLINHFDLFGLRQVWLYFRQKKYTPLGFTTPGPYKLIRHPLYFGWLLAFLATPIMTVAHLVFFIGTAAYIFVAIKFEENDLISEHGKRYINYKKSVPMILPVKRIHNSKKTISEAA